MGWQITTASNRCTPVVDETKEDNEEKAPVTLSAERCWICAAIISVLLCALRQTLNIITLYLFRVSAAEIDLDFF